MKPRIALLLVAILGALVVLATFQIAAAYPTRPELPPGWKWAWPPA